MMYLKKLYSNFRLSFILSTQIFFISLIFSLVSAHQDPIKGTNKILGGDFTLKSPVGPLSLSDLRGSVVLIFFGYTSCPSVCPISLAKISYAFNKMDQNYLNRTKALFISLDPDIYYMNKVPINFDFLNLLIPRIILLILNFAPRVFN